MPWLSSEALGLCTFTAKVSLILNQGTKILQSTPTKGKNVCLCVCVCGVCVCVQTHTHKHRTRIYMVKA